MVREHAYRKAQSAGGMAKLDYDDIMWSVFDGEPGTKHCYKLMRKAAGVPGFEHRDPSDGNKHLAVNADRAKRSTAFSPRTKPSTEGVTQ
jgi:hypothetical protein